MPFGQFKHEPYGLFRSSATPAGLYARQKWLKEPPTASWKADFSATVAKLHHGQSSNGLWRNSVVETIQRLFGLHLTVRHPDPSIEKGLDALLGIALTSGSDGHSVCVSAERLRGLPFTHGEREAVIVPATLFLCTIYGRSAAPAVLALYDRVAGGIFNGTHKNSKASRLHNSLRAMVVHPQYADHHATRRLVSWLADRQTRQGHWGQGIPFYQALNALAHLDTTGANRQTEKAFDYLLAIQNADGSWAASERQWCTFLAVHALRSKGRV
jgi:hypothetical protein